MTTDELALDYFRRAKVRRQVLDLLHNAGEYADVVREAQELIERAMNGMLRWAGIDPPRWHDVGSVLIEHRGLLPAAIEPSLEAIVKASARLRKEREAAFYGEIDLVPGRSYDLESAKLAMEWADLVLAALQYFD